MSKREAILRYGLIIKKLRKHSATFKEISDFLAFESELHSYNFNISKRTFHRDLDDIRVIYNIDIQYDTSQKVYFIDYEEKGDANQRLIEAFDTLNAFSFLDNYSKYISFEKRNSQGTENLHGLLHTIKNSLNIKFIYKKYWENEQSLRKCEPLALKEFKNRWYLIAKDIKDDIIKSFALDRIHNIEITNKHFTPPRNFDVNEYYKYTFGIIGSHGKKPEEIILSFNLIQGKYIKSLPLHETQKIITDTEEKLDISLKLVITYDFIMEILSFGENVKVIKPANLINEMKNIYINCLKQY